jgi:hypothetical protein
VQKKINDKVTFPLVLDMNKYVSRKSKDGEEGREGGEGGGSKPLVDEFDLFLQRRIKELRSGTEQTGGSEEEEKEEEEKSSSSVLPDLVDCNGTVLPPAPASAPDSDSVSEPECLIEECFDHDVDPLELVREKGEWVYELYAVLVHSGAISGGHYYVYIRDTSTNKWWNFNDSSVTEVTEKTVLEAQGGFRAAVTSAHSSYSSSSYIRYPAVYPARQVESCANAYMLMYRKVTAAAMAVEFPGDELVPAYIREEVQRVTEEAERKKQEVKERMNKMIISVFWKKKKYEIATTRTTLYKDFLQQAWTQLPILQDEPALFAHLTDTASAPLENMRLRAFNTYYKMAGQPFDAEQSGHKTLDVLRVSLNKEMFIEVKATEDEWEAYESDGLSLLMTEFDAATNSFKDHVVLRVPKKATVGEFLLFALFVSRVAITVMLSINHITCFPVLIHPSGMMSLCCT